ncbi:MAG: hypothetical protein WC444_05670 [Candidatus Paceibacterota bacterium]
MKDTNDYIDEYGCEGSHTVPGEDISRLTREYNMILEHCSDLGLITYKLRLERELEKLNAKFAVVHRIERDRRRAKGIY